MSRLRRLPATEFSSDLREFLGQDALDDQQTHGVVSIWAQRPELALAYRKFNKAVVENSILPRRLIELVRLRIAYHNQCRSCMAVRYSAAVAEGVSEDLVCELEVPEQASNLLPREVAALRFADLFATDHLSISTELFDELKEHFCEPEIVELSIHVAIFVGFGRMAMSWDAVDNLPERFRDKTQKVTPWGGGAKTINDRFRT